MLVNPIHIIQLPIDPTPTELCMIIPKYNIRTLLVLCRQCMYVRSDNRLRLSIYRSYASNSNRSIRFQQKFINIHYVGSVCINKPTTDNNPYCNDFLLLYFIYTIQRPTDPTPIELCMMTSKFNTKTM